MANIKITLATEINEIEIDSIAQVFEYKDNPDQSKLDFVIEKLTMSVNKQIVDYNKFIKLKIVETELINDAKDRLEDLNDKVLIIG